MTFSLFLSLSLAFSLFFWHPRTVAWAGAWIVRSACFWNSIQSAKTDQSPQTAVCVAPLIHYSNYPLHSRSAPKNPEWKRRAGWDLHLFIHTIQKARSPRALCSTLQIKVSAAYFKYFDAKKKRLAAWRSFSSFSLNPSLSFCSTIEAPLLSRLAHFLSNRVHSDLVLVVDFLSTQGDPHAHMTNLSGN